MFDTFFIDMQQNIKLFLLPPILCAVFRAIFIWNYSPYTSLRGKGKMIYHCFRFGFWLGMDINAYVLLVPMAVVTIPGMLFPQWLTYGNYVRITLMDSYLVLLYFAFIGKLIFYSHFHDIYNSVLWLGKKAEKNNLLDIFFHEHYGIWVLLGLIPYVLLCTVTVKGMLALPSIPYPHLSAAGSYLFNALAIAVIVVCFYFFRYGGSLDHSQKPRLDRIPTILSKDIFFAKAAIDDLVALNKVWEYPLHESVARTEEENEAAIGNIIPAALRNTWRELPNPAYAFRRKAGGAKIKKPQRIFFVVGECYSQMPFDKIYESLHIVDGGKKFRADPHTVSINDFLSAGDISRPSLVGLISGIFDARLELNEREAFWHRTLPTALPEQLKKLGYESVYWYGGNAAYGNMDKFALANGFDRVMSAPEFCAKDAPRTWVGIYDHIFLRTVAETIKETDTGKPVFHFVYTTSNHSPFKIDVKKLGYDTERIMPQAPKAIKNSRKAQKALGTHWYSDWALVEFIEDMKKTYPDSLIIVTGDHSYTPIMLNKMLERADYTFRERFCTSFMMHHREINQAMLAGNTIGGHMNIMPTIMELIAPEGFTYYSLFPPLTEPFDHVVTPYHWLTRDAIGAQGSNFYQPLTVSAEELPTLWRDNQLNKQADDWCALTNWLVRHTDRLDAVAPPATCGGKTTAYDRLIEETASSHNV